MALHAHQCSALTCDAVDETVLLPVWVAVRVDEIVKLAVVEVEADADSVCVVDGEGVPLAETSGVKDADGLAPKLAVPASGKQGRG